MNEEPPPPYPGKPTEAADLEGAARPIAPPPYPGNVHVKYPSVPSGHAASLPISSSYGAIPSTAVLPSVQALILAEWGPDPVLVTCPVCCATVTTMTRLEPGATTWLYVLIGCLLCGVCGLIPLCLDTCHDVIHSCPECHTDIGRFNR